MTAPRIHRVTTLDLNVRPRPWPFADERRAEIEAHFAIKQREKPKIWNGRILLARDPVFAGDRFSASYFDADFASFLAWRDWGFPDRGVFNGFGMVALRCCDGAVDMAGSVAREVEEETGLTPADYRTGAHWDCVVSGAAIAMIRMLNVEVKGEQLRATIEANLARQDQPELSAVHLVRDSGDLTASMPRFVTAFIEQQFSKASS